MLTCSDCDAISPVKTTQKVAVGTEPTTQAQATSEPKYDSVTLSSQTAESRFRKELDSRLAKDVRTATSTGDIHRLRQEVADGTYTPDPMRIARRILFFSEE
jgi:anti-sigma28 factor (negative regulator of flagellin synthesis)